MRYLKTAKKGFTRREDSKDDDDELKIKYDDEQYKLDENNQISNKLDIEEDINSQESRKDYQSNSSAMPQART